MKMKIIFKLFLLALIFHYNNLLAQESHILNSDIASGVIYEANIRQYSKEGTFNAFARDIPVLRDLGIKIIWLMPVNPISTTKSKGPLGSYYAVSDYKKVNPDIDLGQFAYKQLRDYLNQLLTINIKYSIELLGYNFIITSFI